MTSPARNGKPKVPPRVSIRAVREAYGLSIRDLMDRIAEQGHEVKDASTIRNVETGNQAPSLPLITAWARALKLNPVDVVLPNRNGADGEDEAAL